MAGVAPASPKVQFLSSAGVPLVNGTVTTYLAGTTTPTDTWQDSALSVLNTNPISLDARGEAVVWLDSSKTYKFLLKNASGVSQWTVDSISGGLGASTLAASGGAALVGFIQSGTGAVARTAQAKMREIVSVTDFGATGDGTTSDTAAIQAAINSGAKLIFAPAGTYLVGKITVPSDRTIYGAGFGKTTFKLAASTNQSLFVNSDTTDGNSRIVMVDFTIDGNYTNQTSGVHGIAFTKVSDSFIEVESKNNRGTGIVFSGGSGNVLGQNNRCTGNGKAVAGYGLYIFNSNDNQVVGGVYDDNCIGVAVEASGASTTAKRNQVVGIKARSNRADFGQSGAGVHWEQSSGGDASDGAITGVTCTGSTGIGINVTACADISIVGGVIRDNTKTGIALSQATQFLVSGVSLIDNGAGDSVGYQAQLRTDDSGLNPASTGSVAACMVRGSTPDGLKTMSANGSVRFIANDVSGFTSNYTTASTTDVVDRTERGSFTGTVTGLTTSPTGTIKYSLNGDVVTLFIPAINGTSNSTACTVTGMPAAIRPAAQQSVICAVTDNGNNVISWSEVETSGVLTLKNGVLTTFTGSGTKGIQQCTVTYRLTA